VSDQLPRIAKAIHTLFYATERAGERYRALEQSIEGDDELAAFQQLGIGLINFDPLPPEVLAHAAERMKEIEKRSAELAAKKPSERISIEAHNSDEGRYFKRLLEKMYTHWDGTLDYERGVHSLRFYSPFDEGLRRHTTFAYVAVDGELPDVRVRTYTLGPYLNVRDERTRRESDDPWRVLNGDLTPILPDDEPPAGPQPQEPAGG